MYNLRYTKEFEKGLKKLSKAEQRATIILLLEIGHHKDILGV